MVEGTKTQEYRKPSNWIKSRLEKKEYQFIKFVNGYGNDKPFFVCEYKGYKIAEKSQIAEFDGHQVNIEIGDYIIDLGKVIDSGNLAI